MCKGVGGQDVATCCGKQGKVLGNTTRQIWTATDEISMGAAVAAINQKWHFSIR